MTRNPHAGHPITDDDATIAAALEDVSIPTLMLSMVHMTGDPSILRGPLRPQGLFLNEVQGFMSEEDKAEVRRLALDVIRDYRDRGCEPAAPPGPELIKEMMSWLVCADVPDEYVPMLLEEMELDGADGRQVALGSDEAERREFPVVVIGCGQSGLLAGIRLKEAGIPFTIVEKNAGVGGTWCENRYPGCRVDVGNHFYCYSFEPSDQWSEFFAQPARAPALLHRRDGTPRRRRPTCVGRPRSSPRAGTTTTAPGGCARPLGRRDRGDPGRPGRHLGRRPAQPAAPARHRRPSTPSRDPSFHSARWDHDVDLDGKRVALVGAGASGFQIAPAIADRGRAPHRLPAHRAVDVPQPELPRAGRARGPVGPAPPAVLRALVPLPALLAGVRRRARRRPRRPRRTRTSSGRSARPTRSPGRSSRSGSPARSATTRTSWPRSCPTTRPPASARCRTTGAGSARSPATTSSWCATASTTSRPTPSSPNRASATRST